MATPVIIIPGLSSTTKRPAFYGETKFASGLSTAASLPVTVLLVGNKLTSGASSGTMSNDTVVGPITSADDVDSYAGPGSELAEMAYGADRKSGALAIANVPVYLGCVSESTGTVSSASITFSGTWSTPGAYNYRLDGYGLSLSVGATDTLGTVASGAASLINSRAWLPFSATATSAGVCTVLSLNKGVRQNYHVLVQDKTQLPSGAAAALAGGSARPDGGVPFSGGTGNDSPATLLTAIASTQYDRIAPACGDATLDATNLALWKTQVNTQCAPTVGILGHVVACETGTLASAATLAQTTLNDARFQVLHGLNLESHPSQIAATMAAVRAQAEQNDPDASYDDVVLPGIVGSTATVDRPSGTTIETALGEGVTELFTDAQGQVRVSRSIVSRSKNGTSPDYRVLDTSDATVPDYCRQAAKLLWETSFKPNNPRVTNTIPAEMKQPPAGVATPELWVQALTKIAKQFERGEGVSSGVPILTDVANNLPDAQWNAAGKFIVSAWPVVPMPNNHIMGLSVRQVSNS